MSNSEFLDDLAKKLNGRIVLIALPCIHSIIKYQRKNIPPPILPTDECRVLSRLHHFINFARIERSFRKCPSRRAGVKSNMCTFPEIDIAQRSRSV